MNLTTAQPSPLGDKCNICGALKSLGCVHLTKNLQQPQGAQLLQHVDMGLVQIMHDVLLKYQTSRGKVVSHEYAQQLFAECDAAIMKARRALDNNPSKKPQPAAAVMVSGGSGGGSGGSGIFNNDAVLGQLRAMAQQNALANAYANQQSQQQALGQMLGSQVWR